MASISSQLQVTMEGNLVNVRGGTNDYFWGNFERGAWEPDTQVVFKRFIDAQHSYIDIGAWIGPTLLLGCQLARRAYGIEPDPIAYPELVENMNNNQALTNNVQLFNICITPVSGKVSFGNGANGGDSMSSLLFSSEKTHWTVDGMNFQEWIEQNQINDCNFIKMDIEGGEYSVLPTMAAYLREHRPTLHLSLHPCNLGELAARGIKKRLKRSLLRLGNTMKILRLLWFYRHWYDTLEQLPAMNISLRSRIRVRHRLAKLRCKPISLIVVCLLSIFGRTGALVLTDQEW